MILQALRNEVIAQSSQAVWDDICQNASDTLMCIACGGSSDPFKNHCTEHLTEYGINPTQIQGFIDAIDNYTHIITNSGRFYLYENNRWVTDSDDSYGSNYHQMNENGGTGSIPVAEWEHLGIIVNKGDIIKELKFVCRTNSNEVTDIEFYIVNRVPTPITRWETGLDNDSEDVSTPIFQGNFVIPGMSGNMTDIRRRIMDINFQIPEDSFLSIYLRPVGDLDDTRYLYATWKWTIQ